jgi:hypothetical protein
VSEQSVRSEGEARRRVAEYLASQSWAFTPVIVGTKEFPVGWVFFYDSQRLRDSQATSDALAGNAPILIDRRDGTIHVTGTGRPVEEYVEEYANEQASGEAAPDA